MKNKYSFRFYIVYMMDKGLITIVDENDNILWYKKRWTLEHWKDIYRISGLWLENSRWEVLIAQRAYSKKNQWWKRWPAAAWTVEKWETYESNILKESQEEIWLELKDYEIGVKEFVHAKENNDRKYFRQRFIAQSDKKIEEFEIQKEEVEKIMRISKQDLINWIEKKSEDFVVGAIHYIDLFYC